MATKFEMEAFEKDTQDMAEAILKIVKRKRPAGVAAVTHDERVHFAYPREFEDLASNLRELVAEAGVRLSQPVEAMDESLAIAATLKPLLKVIKDEIGFLETEVEDTIDKHRSDAWKIFTAYYTALSGVVVGNGTLEAKFAPLAELFKVKKTAKPKQAVKEVVNEDKEPTPEPAKVKEANG